MGLNLSRGETLKYYSSDRIAQLVGNGLLTFIDEKTFLKDLKSLPFSFSYKVVAVGSIDINSIIIFPIEDELPGLAKKMEIIQETPLFVVNRISEYHEDPPSRLKG